MKTYLLAMLLPLAVLSISSTALSETRPWLITGEELQEGATIEEVTAALGEPLGSLGSDTFRIYHFNRGEVVFRDGLLVSHSLVSEQEARERREEAEARREQQRRERAERRAERHAEGESIKERHLADPSFNALSPRVRLTFWQQFQREYPDNDARLQLTLARAEVQEADRLRLAELERERRILAAETQIAEAEARARQAEARAAERDRVVYYETIVRPPRRGPSDHRDRDRSKAPSEETPAEPRRVVREPPPPPPGSEAYPFPRDPRQQDGAYAFPRDPSQTGPYPFKGEPRK